MKKDTSGGANLNIYNNIIRKGDKSKWQKLTDLKLKM